MKRLILSISSVLFFVALPFVASASLQDNVATCPTDGALGFNCTGSQNFPDDNIYGYLPVSLLYNPAVSGTYTFSGNFISLRAGGCSSSEFDIDGLDYTGTSDGNFTSATRIITLVNDPSPYIYDTRFFQQFPAYLVSYVCSDSSPVYLTSSVYENPNFASTSVSTTTDQVTYRDWLLAVQWIVFLLAFGVWGIIFSPLRKK